MDWIALLATSSLLLIALLVCHLLALRFGSPRFEGRFESIDGLRGFLAFFVFVHHCYVWRSYAVGRIWASKDSDFFTHLGHDSVWVFFMITGFLFFSKLIDARERRIDWTKLYVSRSLRLYPLYIFLVILLFASFLKDGGMVVEGMARLFLPAFLFFNVAGTPFFIVSAGVLWTLAYEWMFYLSLPVQALCLCFIPPIFFILAGVAGFAVCCALYHPCRLHGCAFAAGMAAAVLVRSDFLCSAARTKHASVAIFFCVILVLLTKPGDYDSCLILGTLAFIFILIACGNTLFGILTAPAVRFLGGMSYSVYLLHGPLLYALYHFIIGMKRAGSLTLEAHWLCAAAVTPVLIMFCFTTWQVIEKPPLRHVSSVTNWLHAHLAQRRAN